MPGRQVLGRQVLGREVKDLIELPVEGLLDQQRARDLTSGKFEHRGDPQAIGHYLLSLVLQEKGQSAAAEAER